MALGSSLEEERDDAAGEELLLELGAELPERSWESSCSMRWSWVKDAGDGGVGVGGDAGGGRSLEGGIGASEGGEEEEGLFVEPGHQPIVARLLRDSATGVQVCAFQAGGVEEVSSKSEILVPELILLQCLSQLRCPVCTGAYVNDDFSSVLTAKRMFDPNSRIVVYISKANSLGVFSKKCRTAE